MPPLIDGCGRTIDHLRLSLTDHCNLACRYCVADGVRPAGRMIDEGFAVEVVRWLAGEHGFADIRLTGGEPLMHPRVLWLVERIAALPGVRQVSMTTNGQALARMAPLLRDAGLARVNVSLDTLDEATFTTLTRGGKLAHTLAGIEAACASGLWPVKLNAIAQRGVNEFELADLAAWGLARGCIVRFLEVMPIGPAGGRIDDWLIPAEEILARLEERFRLLPLPREPGQPSVDYAAEDDGLRGVIGVVAPTTRPFCERCRRMRVTASGLLVACVHDRRHFDLKACWEDGVFHRERAEDLLHEAAENKPAAGSASQTLTMISLGG